MKKFVAFTAGTTKKISSSTTNIIVRDRITHSEHISFGCVLFCKIPTKLCENSRKQLEIDCTKQACMIYFVYIMYGGIGYGKNQNK